MTLLDFFKYQYRINARSIFREQRSRMHSKNFKLWGSSTVTWCDYADDLIVFMLDIHSLQRATAILDEVFTNYRVCISVSKTETMVLNHMLLEDEYRDTIISLIVCFYHVTYEFESESTLYSCLNVKELLARSRRHI